MLKIGKTLLKIAGIEQLAIGTSIGRHGTTGSKPQLPRQLLIFNGVGQVANAGPHFDLWLTQVAASPSPTPFR